MYLCIRTLIIFLHVSIEGIFLINTFSDNVYQNPFRNPDHNIDFLVLFVYHCNCCHKYC